MKLSLNKLRPDSKGSSVESLIAENPGIYTDDNITKGLKSSQGSPSKSYIDSKQAQNPNFKKQSPDRKSITEQDKELARSYGGKPRGSLKPTYKGKPKRIKRNDTKEMFPSLAVENQAKDKLNKIVDWISKRDQDSDNSGSKFERNNELRK